MKMRNPSFGDYILTVLSVTALGLLSVALAGTIAAGLIWSVNTLFPVLAIPYTVSTLLAAQVFIWPPIIILSAKGA